MEETTETTGLEEGDIDRIRNLVHHSLSGEFATVTNNKPVTYPLTPLFDEDKETVIVSSPPAFAEKVESVKQNPRVSILLHDDDGEYLVTGEATIREADPKANAEYVRSLMESEPDSSDFQESLDFLDSWLGQKLMGWYALRTVVEIEPTSISRVGTPTEVSVPPWPAVDMTGDESTRYERAVVTVGRDDDFPETVPLESMAIRDETALLNTESELDIDDGQPACLLVHWHDETIERLGQRIVLGRLSRDENGLKLDAGSSRAFRNDGLLDSIRFIITGKLRTRAYFKNQAGETGPQ